MFLTEVKKYRKDNIIYVGADVPEGATILETLNILNAEDGYTLIRISDGEDMSNSLWLRDGDSQGNYKEVEIEEEPEID